jgi:hypothetical protein
VEAGGWGYVSHKMGMRVLTKTTFKLGSDITPSGGLLGISQVQGETPCFSTSMSLY